MTAANRHALQLTATDEVRYVRPLNAPTKAASESSRSFHLDGSVGTCSAKEWWSHGARGNFNLLLLVAEIEGKT